MCPEPSVTLGVGWPGLAGSQRCLIRPMWLECAHNYSRMYSVGLGCEASNDCHLFNMEFALVCIKPKLREPRQRLLASHWVGWISRLPGSLLFLPSARSIQADFLGLKCLLRAERCLPCAVLNHGLRKDGTYTTLPCPPWRQGARLFHHCVPKAVGLFFFFS